MKLTIITGGSRGLGSALFDHYKTSNYEVLEFSRNGTSEQSVRLDFSKTRTIIDTLSGIFDKYDSKYLEEVICYNNAGTLSPMGIASQKTPDKVVENININFTGAILFLNEFIKYFQDISCRKTIVNISSGAALKGYNGWSLYCAAKAGLDNFIRAVSLEQREMIYPIIALNIDPGIINTDMQKSIREADEKDFPEKHRFIEYKQSGALVEPLIVAKRIAEIIDNSIEGGQRYNV